VFSARACIQHYCTCQPNEFNNVVSHLWKSKSLRIRVSTDVSSAAGTDPILIKVLLICWAYLNPSLEKACFLFYGSLRSPSQIDRDHGRLRAVCFKELAIKTVRKTFDFFSYLVSRCNGKILDRHVWLYSFPVGLIKELCHFFKVWNVFTFAPDYSSIQYLCLFWVVIELPMFWNSFKKVQPLLQFANSLEGVLAELKWCRAFQ